MSGRPLDELEAAVGAEVSVRLKSGEHYRGTLAGFDQHMNLVLEELEDGPEHGESPAPDGGESDEAAERPADPSSDSAPESAPGTGASLDRDTTIIRGDNVVSITL